MDNHSAHNGERPSMNGNHSSGHRPQELKNPGLTSGYDPFNGPSKLDLEQVFIVFRIIRERFWWGLLAGVVLAGIYAAFALSTDPVYATEAYLLIEAQAERVIDVERVVDTSLTTGAESELENHLRKMRSRKFLMTVVKSFGEEETNRILRPYQAGDEAPSLAAVVSSCVNIRREDQLFTISAQHRDPEMAALLANRYAAQYISDTLARSWTGNESARAFLEQQADELKARIAETEKKLTDYRSENNLISLEENQNIIVSRLNSIDARKTAARMEQLDLEAAVEQVEQDQASGGGLTEISYITKYGNVQQLLVTRKNLETELAALSLKYLERHPSVVEATERLEQTSEQLDREVERAVKDLYNRKQEVDLRMARLTDELKQAEAEALALGRKSVEYNVMRRELESDRATFDTIIARLNETNLSGKLDTTNLRILDEALVPVYPVSPNAKKVAVVAVLLILVGLAGLPLLLEAIDNRLRSSQDVEQFIGKPVLASLPYLKKVVTREWNPNVVLNENDESLSERFRVAYSSLNLQSRINLPKVIMVTSTLPSEGKSFITANLAACMANHGLRCLLIDADFRRPTLHRHFELRNDRGIMPWIEAYEASQVSLRDLRTRDNSIGPPVDRFLDITRISYGFDFLRSGGSTRQATELIESTEFDQLLRTLKGQYDVIFLDTPPAAVFTDAQFLADLADEIIYVARFKQVSRQKARKFIQKLDHPMGKVVGLIVNGHTSNQGDLDQYEDYYKHFKDYVYDAVESEDSPSKFRPHSRRSLSSNDHRQEKPVSNS